MALEAIGISPTTIEKLLSTPLLFLLGINIICSYRVKLRLIRIIEKSEGVEPPKKKKED